MPSRSIGLRLEMFGTNATRKGYVQIGDGVYRRGAGIFYTVHPAAKIIRRQFLRRQRRGIKVSPSTSRFNRRHYCGL